MTRLHRIRQLLVQLRTDRAGATAIEYALIIALVALAVISSIDTVGQGNAALIQGAADTFDGVTIPD